MLQERETDVRSVATLAVPLCVDLDNTLIRTDILWESAIQLWRRPAVALHALWLLATRGKAALKRCLADAAVIDPMLLPYRRDVLEFVRAQQQAGREVILATATHMVVARQVSDHLGVFHRVLATDGTVNLSGEGKQKVLVATYGARGFDYIGDSRKDLPIFAAARNALLVNPSRYVLKRANAVGNVSRLFRDDPLNTARTLARTLRLHQWAKNLLLVVPLLAAQRVMDLGAWENLFIAFIGFGLVASATYVVNDLVDLPSDRAHPRKRVRPLASGSVAISTGIALAIVMGVLGFALSAALLPSQFVVDLGIYAALTTVYTFVLKRRLLIDVLTLSGLYTLRILAGGAAINVIVSEWLLMFSLFIFLSLAFLKRSIELSGLRDGAQAVGRGYTFVDLEAVRVMGMSSGLISVLVFALYISSPAVNALYKSPMLLWLVCPLLIYWICRIWLLSGRGEVHHDPVVFALLDFRSYVVGACGIGIALMAKIGMTGFRL